MTNEDYQKLLGDAAWKTGSDFNYEFSLKPEDGNGILAKGSVLLNNEENFRYNYEFLLGKEAIMFYDDLIMFGGRKEDFSKNMHDKIIDFNEQLAKNIGWPKILVKERSENVRRIYLSKGYNLNKNSHGDILEKILK